MDSKPYHHGNLRPALIAVALDLLEQEGSAGLDLRKIARQAGVSHAAPYRHFEDKRALIAAVAEEGFVRLQDQIRAALASSGEEEQLLVVAQVYIHFALEKPALMREMFSGLTIDRAAYPSLHAASKAAFTCLVEVITSEQASGHIVAGAPESIVQVIWSMIYGLAMLLIENQLPDMVAANGGIDGMIEYHMSSLVNGLRPHE